MEIDRTVRKIYCYPIKNDDKIESVTLNYEWQTLFGNKNQEIEICYEDFHSIHEGTIDTELDKKQIEKDIYKTLDSIHRGELEGVSVNTNESEKFNYGNAFAHEMAKAMKDRDYVNWRKALLRQKMLSKSRWRFLEPGVIKI